MSQAKKNNYSSRKNSVDQNSTKHLILIDSNLSNYSSFLTGEIPDAEVIELENGDLLKNIVSEAEIQTVDLTEDNLDDLTKILSSSQNINNLHLITAFESDELQPYLKTLIESDKAFTNDATVYLYQYLPKTQTLNLQERLSLGNSIPVQAEANLVLNVDSATVTTDLDDYPPGATAIITGSNFDLGETIELQVLHTDNIPNTGGGHEPWQVTDGGAEDLDGKVDGKFQTTWYVNPDDSANSAFKLTATGLNSGEVATHHFTDSNPAVQFFYIPKKEADILTAIKAVATNTTSNFNSATDINTVISITVSTNNTIIYYDHWENGYESNLSNPTQSNTQIWGDNDPSNGIAPGYTTDVLKAGNIISLTNSVNPSTTSSVVDYDGEDKIGASKAIVISRPYWPTQNSSTGASGTLIAESVNVYDTSKWGTSYKVPVGENFSSSVNFEYTALFVTAAKNNTTLTITGADTTGDNVADGTITTTINEGQSYFLNGGVLVGTQVTGSNPIQAHLLTGDIGSTYATRAYTLVPTNQWGNSYYTPVGTVVSGKPTDVYLYNPATSGSITVKAQTQQGTTDVSVPAGTSVRHRLTTNSGAYFYTTNINDTFFATTAFDSENSAHDWGFSLIPEENLTPIIQVGWAPGNGAKNHNGNPLWVMATAPTTIYVDYDGDGVALNTDINGTKYDASFNLGTLQTIQITDTKNNDFDQSGIRVYTVDGTNLAGAWGQDANADTGGTSLDLGTEILPLPIAYSWKEFALVNDVNNDGNVDPGDTIEFTINIKNDGVVVLGNVNVSDIIPKGTTYISSSTKIDGTNIGDDTSGTTFPFDDDNIFNNIDDGLNIGNVPVGGSASVTFRMLVNNPYDGNLAGITNSAAVDSDENSLTIAVNAPVDIPTQTKTLYLSGVSDLDRINPVTTNDTTTSTSSNLGITSVASDNFSTGNYTGGTGWKAAWSESSDDNTATGGQIRVNTQRLQFLQAGTTDAIQRSVNLSGHSKATLSYDWQTSSLEESIQVLISNSSTGTFTVLGTYTGTTSNSATFDISSYISNDTTIKIQNNSGNWNEANDIAYFDNFNINAGIISTTFNQSISMKSDFEMPSGKPVTVSAYINASTGTPSISSNIAATVTYDSGTLLNLSNPTSVVSQGGGVYLVTWTGTLNNNVTIPTGQDVSLNITNNQSNLNFTVLSDSNTYPSKIDLATRSVIDITSIGIYDNSYANGGGNLVNAASNGNTVYLRVQVKDPFGDYDITGLAINITDPNNNNLSTINLTSTSDVDTTTDGKRIYEYAWTPPSTIGNYTLNVTAKEGYENTVTDTASTTLNLNNGTVPNVIIGDATATEGNLLVFDVSLSTASTSDIILDLATTDGTATGISDYEINGFEYSTDGGTNWIAAGGTNGSRVTIPAGNTNIKVRINSVSDSTDEPNETFILGVKSVVSGSVGNTSDTGTGTITDDDPTPSISISDVSLTEGNSNTKQFNFTVSLSNASSQTVSVNYATANGTATIANSDYTSATGTVTFAPGETTKTLTVNVTGDTTVEPNETFFVNLSSATNATIIDSQGIGTILNDDNIALLAINDVSVTEGNSGTKILTFTVTRSGLTTSAVTVNYATANNTATTANNDYVSTSGTLSFASGETSKTISVTINGDTPPEADETFFVNLSNATNATIIDSQGVGTILNDDASGTITGRVLADTNNDNTGDTPLSGVTIELLDSSGNAIDSDPNTSGVQPTTTTTNSNGDYTFSNVTPGSYRIKETDPTGYGSVSDGDTTDGNDDTPANTNTNDNLIPVTITANEVDSGNNFVDEQLGTISGTVLKDTNNDDIGDTPLSGVTIELLDSNGNPIDSDPNTTGIQPTTTTTNSNGNYSFTNVAPGNYKVAETDPAGYSSVKDSDNNGNNNLIDVTLATGGSSTGNDFVDEQYGSISGNVSADTDNNNTGDVNLNNVTLELLDSSGNSIDSDLNTAGIQATTTTTNASGNYTFSNLAPGTYQVRQTNLTGYGDVSDVDGGNPNLITNINVTAGGAVTGRNFIDEQYGSISGNVSADTDNNNTGDVNLNNVTLELLDSSGNSIDSDLNTAGIQATTTTTNASGNYTFSNLAPGTYQVRQTNLTGYGDVSDVDGGNPNLITNINVTAGGAVTGRNFIDEQYGSISGNVSADTDNNNTGDVNLNNVTLELLDSSGNSIDSDLNTAGIQATTTTTNASGNYTFSNLAPGTYQVRQTNLTGYGDVSDVDGGNPNLITNINVTAGGAVTGRNFIDEQYGSISGNVSADTDNNNTGDVNLNNVTLELLDSSGNSIDSDSNTSGIQATTTTTDSNGNYTFSNVTPGSYQVKQTDLSGYISVSDGDSTNAGDDTPTNTNTNDNLIPVTINANETDSGNDFIDEPLRSISGTVLADTNNDNTGDSPLSGVTIELLDSSGNSIDSNSTLAGVQPTTTTTASDGSYSFANLAPGNYQVKQTNLSGYLDVSDIDGGNLNNISVNLNAGNSTGNNFVDEQTGTISGQVLADAADDDNIGDNSLSGVTLELLDNNGDPVIDGNGNPITTTTDSNGIYSFTGVAPGTYQVRQTNLAGYGDVNELDSIDDSVLDTDLETANVDNDNLLTVDLTAGESDTGNDFIDKLFLKGTDSAENFTASPGNDVIIGYKGEDTLTGGTGNDTYFLNETSDGLDSITDFTPGEDKIDLSQILVDEVTNYTTGDPFTQGYVELLGFNHPTYGASTIVQIDFDAGDESTVGDLYHKDIVFLRGVDVANLQTSRDFII
ncbi:conserved repeat domain protein [Stanieria cyanosphaera PCC 7437]|uniref:Conserved repeat domain protein n=1 Tax=Stanieria cyanosphaera (strain ATCC 29371 / PCC 7437) TaxID=111780 RepID=K9XZY2_STAC7|nr:SpaA isopeptide-forming pilin-related protein [Stanieria cyanosphaera]AFZ37589.1 conserved repeat domain protein [Stanieria cyanosphaera PCC 7437]